MNKLYLLVFLMLPCISSASVFEESYSMTVRDFSREANRVTYYAKDNVALDKDQQDKELRYLTAKLNSLQDSQKTNPVYWFVRGLHARNLASYFQYFGELTKVDKQLLDKNKFYQRAMDLDKIPPMKLSAVAYAVMKPGLPDELKQRAIETEISLGGSGEDDSYYWYLHWSNINVLSQQGRFNEAQLAMEKMQKDLDDQGLGESAYLSLLNRARQEVKEHKRNVEAESDALPVKQKKDSNVAGFINEYIYYLVWFAVVLLIIILAFVLYMYDKKRKSN